MADRIWLVGAGNMGGAMLRRWVASGTNPAAVTVIDSGMPDVPMGVRVVANARDAGLAPDTVVLAVKPQQLDVVAEAIRSAMAHPPALLVSILAGIEETALRARFEADTVVRAMPNLPVAIGQGVTALYSSSQGAEARTIAEALVRPLGHVEWITQESLFDAVTALSGCGPGFVFRFVDALAAAGAALGLPEDQARRLALATVAGSGVMAAEADVPPAVLADRVASPGGSTREGLNVLDRDHALRQLLIETLAAAARRNAELAKLAR